MWWSCSRAGKSPFGKHRQRGGALIAALFLVIIALLLTTGYVDTLTAENKTAKENEAWALALYAADAGIQYALEHIRTAPPPAPTDPPNGVGAIVFTTRDGNAVQFKLEQIGTTCPDGSAVESASGLPCAIYRCTGTVTDSGNRLIARKLVDATITIGARGNILTWKEHFI